MPWDGMSTHGALRFLTVISKLAMEHWLCVAAPPSMFSCPLTWCLVLDALSAALKHFVAIKGGLGWSVSLLAAKGRAPLMRFFPLYTCIHCL